MKRLCLIISAALLLFALCALPAAAYINRGTVEITCDTTELSLKVGETVEVPYTLDPETSDQMPGCGMADCPENCGANCLSKDGNCTCDDINYKTYYTEVQVKKADDNVVQVTAADGVATFTAVGPGSCTVNLAARLREFTGSSVDIQVTVTGEEKTGQVWPWIVAAILIAAAAAVIVRKNRTHSA